MAHYKCRSFSNSGINVLGGSFDAQTCFLHDGVITVSHEELWALALDMFPLKKLVTSHFQQKNPSDVCSSLQGLSLCEVWHRIRLPPEAPFWLIYAAALRCESRGLEAKRPSKQASAPISPYLLKLLRPSLPLAIVPVYRAHFEDILLFPKHPLLIFQHGCPNDIISGTMLGTRSRAPSWTHGKGRKNKLGPKPYFPR